MIRLQAKHFGMSVKNKVQNLKFEDQRQKNLHLEKQKKDILNQNDNIYSTF